MFNKNTSRYKIGRSKNPEYREKTLQSQEPDVELIQKWVSPKSAEKTLHQKFKAKRKRGEWFELAEDDIVIIKEIMIGY